MIPALDELQDVIAEADWPKRLARFRTWSERWVQQISAQHILDGVELSVVRDVESLRAHVDYGLTRMIGAMLDTELNKAVQHSVEPWHESSPLFPPVSRAAGEVRRVSVRILRFAPRGT